jgi:UDP-N-acetylmuramoylalanine--D-glutamate ligase
MGIVQKLAQFKNKNILVLGAGLTGMSCARFLQKHNIDFSINDSRQTPVDLETFKTEFPMVPLFTGSWNAEAISQADIILASPGVDLTISDIKTNISDDCDVMGDVELYTRLTNTPTLAVTGSNGKSTVVSLLAYLGNALGFNTQLGGNIGVPVLDVVDEKIDFLVLELSSFQLETMTSMNAIASCILNVSDDHLDRHQTMDNYTNIKQRIYPQANVAIINRDDVSTHLRNAAEQVSFGSDKPSEKQFGLLSVDASTFLMFGDKKLINLKELPLAGAHNALNYLAALALGQQAGWSLDAMVDHLSGFEGLPHRCQRVETSDNIHWINDSKATNVGATVAAISGFAKLLIKGQKIILIAGGDAKGADLSPLGAVVSDHVSQLYVLGKDAHKFIELIDKCIHVESIEEAVHKANAQACHNDIVLLSPACASIDMFKNFVERGNAFMQAVQLVQEAS